MSTSMTWFAVSQKPVASILKTFVLADTGKPSSAGTSKIMGAMLPNGWYLIVLDEFWHPFMQIDASGIIKIDPMENLSYNRANDCEVVGCSESESTNASLAFFHRNGNQVWRVAHILDEGAEHFDTEGTLPAGFEHKLAESIKASQQEHYDAVYGLPALLAQEMCGFHYDQIQSLKFTELVQIPIVPGTKIIKTICTRIEPLLENLGFIKETENRFVMITSDEEISCQYHHGTSPKGGDFDLFFEVRNNHVLEIYKSYVKEHYSEEMHDAPTFRRGSCEIFKLSSYMSTADDLAEWLSQTEAKLPGLVERFKNINSLEALANDGSQLYYDKAGKIRVSYTDSLTGLSGLILAYLVGNPNFDQMIVETDVDRPQENATYAHDLAVYLRKNVAPLANKKSLTNLFDGFIFLKKIKQLSKKVFNRSSK